MIIEHSDLTDFISDQHYFLHDKTQSVYKMRNIKNQCVELFSSLIEIFGDDAVTCILRCIYELNGTGPGEMLEEEK